MRFLADQDVYWITVEWLRKEGHDVVTAKELGMERAADEELLREAKRLDRRLLTRDKGFGALVFLRRELSAGVILLRITPTTVEEVHRELRRLLRNIPKSNCAIFSAWSSRTATGSVAFGRTDHRGIGQAGVAPFKDGDGI